LGEGADSLNQLSMILKRMIQQTGLYEYLKYSLIFRLYERVFKPRVAAAHKKEVLLYRKIVGKADLIFDIGAYDGHKTAAFLEIGHKVVACEPDPYNFRLLGVRFRRRKRRVVLCQKAVADRVGIAALLIHHPGSAFNTLNVKWKAMLEADGAMRWKEEIRFVEGEVEQVATVTLDELIRLHGMPDFIKIDVEGYEKQVFDGLGQKVRCVSFECQLPEFRDDLLAILQKLMDLGPETVFNVVYEEELVLPEFVGYDRIVTWLGQAELFSFDMVARIK
jgi:FkbM family methyltransferase